MAFGNVAMGTIALRYFNYTYVWWDEDGNQQMSPEFRHPHDYAVWLRANLPRIEEQERRMREKREEAERDARDEAADAKGAAAEPAGPEPAAPSGGVVEDGKDERRDKQTA